MKRLEQIAKTLVMKNGPKKIRGSDGSERPLFDFLFYDTN
jgi:hypothetical protein